MSGSGRATDSDGRPVFPQHREALAQEAEPTKATRPPRVASASVRPFPPIPPSDPKNWDGWWRPFLAVDLLVVIAFAAWFYVRESPSLGLGLLSLPMAMYLFAVVPLNWIGVVAGGVALALAMEVGTDTGYVSAAVVAPEEISSRELWRGVFPDETKSAVLHRELDAFLRLPIVACAVSFLVGAVTRRVPRPIRDLTRRARFDRDQRRRIARGVPPVFVPGDALWGVPYERVPLERPEYERRV